VQLHIFDTTRTQTSCIPNPLPSSSPNSPQACAQVFCTFLLATCTLFSSPDILAIILLSFCCIGNYAWLQHIDSGWGSENAKILFQVALPVAGVGFVGGIFRRWKYPDCITPDSDDEDSDEEDEEYTARRASMDMKKEAMTLIKAGKGKMKKQKQKKKQTIKSKKDN